MNTRLLPDKDDNEYWDDIREEARLYGFDGCSHVLEIHRDCCLEHDFHYRFGETLEGAHITRREADRRFRQCNEHLSKFGKYSPLAWWRWLGVRIGGGPIWADHRRLD